MDIACNSSSYGNCRLYRLRAERWQQGAFKAVERLKLFPVSGRIVPEKNRKDIREVLYGNYRIIYYLPKYKKDVVILTLRHGKQILPLDEIDV